MDLNSPETWRWIWAVVAIVFLLGELVTPATFFFLPFAIGATVGAILGFIGAPIAIEWFVFMVVSSIAFGSLWRFGRQLESRDEEQEGVGATRWIGQEATVVQAIGESSIGTVRLEREEWRAESLTGAAVRAGSTVVITRIAGTRLVVVPVDEPSDDLPPQSDINSSGPTPGSAQGAN